MENSDANKTIDAYLKVIGDVLLRSFLIGFAFLMIGSLAQLFFQVPLGDLIEALIGIELDVFAAIWMLSSLTFKMCLFTFFLFPYIAIRWTLSRRNETSASD